MRFECEYTLITISFVHPDFFVLRTKDSASQKKCPYFSEKKSFLYIIFLAINNAKYENISKL